MSIYAKGFQIQGRIWSKQRFLELSFQWEISSFETKESQSIAEI